MPNLGSEGIGSRRRLCMFAVELGRIQRNPQRVESTGVGRKGDEPISESLGELVKGLAFSTSMAADLALVEDQ